MKFVTDKDEVRNVSKHKNVELKKENDQLDIEEIKQPEEVKTKSKPVIVKETWNDMTPTTLVNLRKEPNMKSEVLTTVKGGETVKVSSSFLHNDFKKVTYKGKKGYINKKYLRKI